MTNRLYLYELAPIDEWTGWTKVQDYAATLEDRERAMVLEQFHEARTVVLASPSFDGVIREGWYMAPLPKSDADWDGWNAWMFAVKIDANGITFLVSPYELPWLGVAE